MKQDIADRLEILEGQRAEAKQLRKQARRAHRNYEAESLTAFINFTNRCIQECYREDAENWLDSLPEQTLNRPGFPGECFICELRLPDHRF
ncbi:hypothetical protein U9452_12605 [Escherichia coli]